MFSLGNIGVNAAVNSIATLFGRWVDGFGNPADVVSPAELELWITAGEPVIMRVVTSLAPAELLPVRAVPLSVVRAVRQRQPGGHPYKWVIQELHRHHPGHAQVLDGHLEWYRSQMDQALDWLFPATATPAAGAGSADNGSAQR